jgi:invasion protein IalB
MNLEFLGMKIVFSAMLGLLIVVLSCAANAQVKDKTFKSWTVYTTELQGKKACYLASFPSAKTGNYTKRDEPYFLVTKIGDGIFELSVSSGYEYKANSDVKADIQGDKYNMFTKGDLAWAKDSKQDAKMIAAMKKKNNINIRGTSLKGSYSVDKYSLAGFGDAYNRMNTLCE